MSALVDEGKVKAVGVSNYGEHHLREILEVIMILVMISRRFLI